MKIYIYRNSQKYGPYSLNSAETMLKKGQVFEDDLAWYSGVSDWQSLSKVLSHARKNNAKRDHYPTNHQRSTHRDKNHYARPKSRVMRRDEDLVFYENKSNITAGILALLLGGIGAHRFYLGQTGVGLLYFLFCWTGLPTLIGWIEGIIYLTMSNDDFHLRHVKRYEMRSKPRVERFY